MENILQSGKAYFEKSNLKLEIYSVPDSIWTERNPKKTNLGFNGVPIFKIRQKYLSSDGTYQYNTSEFTFLNNKSIDEDSLIKSLKSQFDINYIGRYSRALYSISNKSDFLMEYLRIRESAGMINPQFIADRMLKSNVDLNDYFTKRLIITEIVY